MSLWSHKDSRPVWNLQPRGKGESRFWKHILQVEKAAGCCLGGLNCIFEPDMEVKHSTDHLCPAWQGGSRRWWPLLCNERLSDHIGYLITKLPDVSLWARTLGMQKTDPIASLTFSMYQMLMEKGARIAPQRQFSVQFKVKAVSWGVEGDTTQRASRVSKDRCWHLSYTKEAVHRIQLLLFLSYSHVPSLLDTHTHTHMLQMQAYIQTLTFETLLSNLEKYIYDIMNMKQSSLMCYAYNYLIVFVNESKNC